MQLTYHSFYDHTKISNWSLFDVGIWKFVSCFANLQKRVVRVTITWDPYNEWMMAIRKHVEDYITEDYITEITEPKFKNNLVLRI